MQTNSRPFNLSWDDNVPIDISFVFEDEKPAGKHGFLTVQGESLVFEDGTPGRFWGVNFNSGANFPPHNYAEMVAHRLAKFGVNIVRTHQMDAEWATPNIFTFNRAHPKSDTLTLDPQSMERLDYLIYCLKEQGIYLYLDLLTYRQFLPGDQVDTVEALPQAAKPYHYFDRPLIELQKAFNAALWTHVNPYTRLAYKDDPCIVLCELVNESDFFMQPVTVEPYRSRLEAMYRVWTGEKGHKTPGEQVDFTKPDPLMARFFVKIMKDYYREMTQHLREIGVKIPLNGTNWSINLGVTTAQGEMDYCDSHCYWNFPLWESSGTSTMPMVSSLENSFKSLAASRLSGKPFFVSEWDHAWPDEWRAESSLAYAAVAAFQGWSGVTIHTYRYSTWEAEDRLGGGAETINGITYRNHFDAANDPAKFGLFYHAALILRRGDLQPGASWVNVEVTGEGDEWLLIKPDDLPALTGLVERHRTGMLLPGQEATQGDSHPAGETCVSEKDGEVFSDTGEMWRSWQKGYGWIDTPSSKAVYGFVDTVPRITLKGLEIEAKTDFAVIALSSLTRDPLEEAKSILLTAVGRCDNSEAEYNTSHTLQTSFGHTPVLIEPIQAVITLHSNVPNLKVFVISQHGELVTRLPVEYAAGKLRFEIGPQPAWNPSTIYYLIRT